LKNQAEVRRVKKEAAERDYERKRRQVE